MIEYEKILGSREQIKILYDILNKRKYNISHNEKIPYDVHEHFVKNNPYRAWYLIIQNNIKIGNFYIQNDNSIGINLNVDTNEKLILNIIEYIYDNYEPLLKIPSLRYGGFFVNVPFYNEKMKNVLINLGHIPTQISFVLNK